MVNLFRSLSGSRTFTSSSRINSSEINFSLLEQKITNWNIPKISSKRVYQQDSFQLKTDYCIKTVEDIISIDHPSTHIQLISLEVLKEHSKKYSYLHIGLVQVAVKPLTRPGLNTAAVISVRDARHNHMADQLFGLIQTSLHEGPTYFNCGPDLTVRLQNSNVHEATTLSIYTQGFDMKAGSHYLAVINRIHYKVMNTLFPNSIMPKSEGETTLFQLSPQHDIYVPKRLKWSEVKLSDIWIIEDETRSRQNKVRSQLEQIVQTLEGDLEIKFSNSLRSIRINSLDRSRPSSSGSKRSEKTPSSYHTAKKPSSPISIHSTGEIPLRPSEINKSKDTGLDYATYGPDSLSELGGNEDLELNVISEEDFIPNKRILRMDFYSERNKNMRKILLSLF